MSTTINPTHKKSDTRNQVRREFSILHLKVNGVSVEMTMHALLALVLQCN
jgi:hypothetical protein